uniref:Putative RPM1-interacting protein 4-like n=1 Tax=Davidia involucrata TaxID=16924 RepID=A0A5B7B5N2_DAVIN
MKKILHQLKGSPTYSTECERKGKVGKERYLSWQLRLLILTVRSNMEPTIPKVAAAFHGAENDIFCTRMNRKRACGACIPYMVREVVLCVESNFLVSAFFLLCSQ